VIDINTVIREVANRTNTDKEIVEIICKHPFKYTVDVMKDDTDIRDILFNQLFKFKLKRRFKENKTTQYTSK